MPNHRYNTPDYTRRGACRRTASAQQQLAPCPSAVQPVYSGREEYGGLDDMPLAMAYVPWQEWQNLYEAEKGFHRGTIFEELDKPFQGVGMGGCRR